MTNADVNIENGNNMSISTDVSNIEAVIAPRNTKGGNAKFSDKLNEQIQTAATYAVGAFRNFKDNWDAIKKTATDERVSIGIV